MEDANIDESTLRLYYFNEETDDWEKYDGEDGTAPDGGVDTTNNYVWALTDHFSIWGVGGDDEGSSSSSSNSGSNDDLGKPKGILPLNPEDEEDNSPINLEEENEKKGLISRITGAMVGVLGKKGALGLIIFASLLITLFVITKFVPRTKNTISSKQDIVIENTPKKSNKKLSSIILVISVLILMANTLVLSFIL